MTLVKLAIVCMAWCSLRIGQSAHSLLGLRIAVDVGLSDLVETNFVVNGGDKCES